VIEVLVARLAVLAANAERVVAVFVEIIEILLVEKIVLVLGDADVAIRSALQQARALIDDFAAPAAPGGEEAG
jgi:hypothetical protein